MQTVVNLLENQPLVDPPAYGIDPVTLVESNCGFNNGSITIAANGLNGPFSIFDGKRTLSG